MYIQQSEGNTQLSVDCNVSDEALFANVKANSNLGFPSIKIAQKHEGTALVVGGGPSIADDLYTIIKMQAEGAKVFALNNAARFLAENGVRADYQIVLDARPQNAEFVRTDRAETLLLASQCSKEVFDAAMSRGAQMLIWHPLIEGIEPHTKDPSPVLIGGGTTVGLSGLCLVYTMGYRNIHLFGYDSCHSEGRSHAYEQDMNKSDQLIRVAINDRVFYSSITMAAQAEKFPALANELMQLGCNLTLHGSGLLNAIMEQATKDERILTACYDLGSSPPTFDFLGFLSEAEKARKQGDYDRLDVIFQPGPVGGFRDDNLPPDVATREGMLFRICVAACRLLPSVRNVEILKERRDVAGDVFPKGWSNSNPVAHYGTRFFKNAAPILKASESAARYVSERFSHYMTITLRESDAWLSRNSNKKEWATVARYLQNRGITPVFIPDTSGSEMEGFENFSPAAWDLDLRMALYQGAIANLGIANGPMALCMLSEAKYLMFKIITPDVYAASAEFLKAHGMEVGDQYGTNGKTVWADDVAEVIIPAVTQLLEERNAR